MKPITAVIIYFVMYFVLFPVFMCFLGVLAEEEAENGIKSGGEGTRGRRP